MLLGLLGGAAGLLIAKAALLRRAHRQSRATSRGSTPSPSTAPVLAFTFGVSIVTGILFGLAPALRAARVDLNTALKAGGRNTQGDGGFGSSRRRLRSLLVVAEVAISLMLLDRRRPARAQLRAAAERLAGIQSRGRHLDAARRRAAASSPNRDAAVAFFRQFGDRIAAVPGVTMRGAVSSLPFTSSVGWGSINVEGWTPQPGQELQVDQRARDAGLLPDDGDPAACRGGSSPTSTAAERASRWSIIDEKFAQRFWPDGDADRQARLERSQAAR